MAPVTATIDINASRATVFAYIADPSTRPQWQDSVVKIELQTPDVIGVGARVRETRRVPGGPRTYIWEVTEFGPDRRWAFRGIDGPVRAYLRMTLTALDGGAGTRVHTELDFEGHGAGRVFAILAGRGARKEMPRDCEHLKQRLEQPG